MFYSVGLFSILRNTVSTQQTILLNLPLLSYIFYSSKKNCCKTLIAHYINTFHP